MSNPVRNNRSPAWRQVSLILLTALGLSSCSEHESGGPSDAPRSLIIVGTAEDSAGDPLPTAVVVMVLNFHLTEWLHAANTLTDSLGRYELRFDSVPNRIDSIQGQVLPPGCHWSSQRFAVSVPPGSPPPDTIAYQVLVNPVPPPASATSPRLCGRASDEGVFGYSGWMRLLVESTSAGNPGNLNFEGSWNVTWSPTYGDSYGRFEGTQTNTFVTMIFYDTLPGFCPPVRWDAPVDPAGNWGIATPHVLDGGSCQWGTFPIVFATDTTTGPW